MDDLIFRLGVALAIGLLVGLERGWREREEADGRRTAGIRTHGIAALLGAVLAALATSLQAPLVLALGFLGFALVFGWFQAREAVAENSLSATSAIVGLCTFALGALAVAGDPRAAAAGGAALAAVLASREMLHRALRRLSWVELRSALMLAVMTTIILPLLPDRTIDPWGGLNPREIWFFTVLTATISYLGYIAARILGPRRGVLAGGLLGAVVSSTAVTLAFARSAAAGAESRALAGAASLAAMVSVLRVTGLVLILQPSVLPSVAPAALAAALVLALCGGLLVWRGGEAAAPGPDRNPFDLGPLLVFAAGFALVSTASAALVGSFGTASLLGSSALSGAFDVDVAVLSALRLEDVPRPAIGQAVLAALAANALVRLLLAAAAGPRAFAWPLAGATLAALVVGGAVAFALPG
ncbi:MgtC/SapB family protein [Falsiroseomonas sp.]|uniref:MgtC/SapB family protein n=1 Tax=Falsiroseomonas sp. TaxID=2870721 RepID=UPI003F710AEA